MAKYLTCNTHTYLNNNNIRRVIHTVYTIVSHNLLMLINRPIVVYQAAHTVGGFQRNNLSLGIVSVLMTQNIRTVHLCQIIDC